MKNKLLILIACIASFQSVMPITITIRPTVKDALKFGGGGILTTAALLETGTRLKLKPYTVVGNILKNSAEIAKDETIKYVKKNPKNVVVALAGTSAATGIGTWIAIRRWNCFKDIWNGTKTCSKTVYNTLFGNRNSLTRAIVILSAIGITNHLYQEQTGSTNSLRDLNNLTKDPISKFSADLLDRIHIDPVN